MNDPTLSRNVSRRIDHWGRRHGNHVAVASSGALSAGVAAAGRGRSRTARSGAAWGCTARGGGATAAAFVAAIAATIVATRPAARAGAAVRVAAAPAVTEHSVQQVEAITLGTSG